MRRLISFHIGITMIMLTIGLIACNSATTTTPPPVSTTEPTAVVTEAAPVTLNWMGHWLSEDKRETLVRETAQEYSFLHQNVTLNLKFPQEIMGVRSKPEVAKLIAKMIKDGNIEWDVIWLDTDIYRLTAEELGDPLWGEKYLVDFGSVEGFAETQKPFIIEDPTYRGETGSIWVGPYIEGYYYTLYYNTDVAAKIGIEIKSEAMTFEDLLGYVQAVYEYNQKQNTRIAAFYEAKDWTTTEILFQSLVKSESPDFAQAKAEVMTSEKQAALLKTLQAFEALGKYKPLIESYADNIWFDTRNLVLEDQALFYFNGTWMYSHWRGIDPNKIGKMIPVELPVFQKVDHYLGGYIPVWGVLKDSPHRDQAVDLLMFWSIPKVAEKWVRYTKNPTGLKGNVSTATTGADVFEQFQSRITIKYGGNVHYSANIGYLLGKQNQGMTTEINNRLIELLTGNLTAEAAYEQIIAQVQK